MLQCCVALWRSVVLSPGFAAVIEMWHCVSDFNETWDARPTAMPAISRRARALFTTWSRTNRWWLFASHFCSLLQFLSFSPWNEYIRYHCFCSNCTHRQPLKLKAGNQWCHILSLLLYLSLFHSLLCSWNSLLHRRSSWALTAVTWSRTEVFQAKDLLAFSDTVEGPLLFIISNCV